MSIENKIGCRWHDTTFQKRAGEVVDAGRQTLRSAALTNGKPVSELDIEAIDRFFDMVTPNPQIYPDLDNWEGQGGLVEHCYFAGEIAYKLAVAVNEKAGTDINPLAQKAALRLHDLGRTSIQSFMETDEMTDILWKQIGIREDLKQMTHDAHLYWDSGEIDFDTLPYSVRISVISDVFGKRSSQDSDRLRHKEEVFEAVKEGKKKYLDKGSRTRYEDELVNRLPSYTEKEEYTIFHTLQWLEEAGMDINTVVDEVMKEYQERKTRK